MKNKEFLTSLVKGDLVNVRMWDGSLKQVEYVEYVSQNDHLVMLSGHRQIVDSGSIYSVVKKVMDFI
jgi:hypothetical protein